MSRMIKLFTSSRPIQRVPCSRERQQRPANEKALSLAWACGVTHQSESSPRSRWARLKNDVLRREREHGTRLILFVAALLISCSVSARAAQITPPANDRFAAEKSSDSPDFRRHVLPLLGRLGCNGR